MIDDGDICDDADDSDDGDIEEAEEEALAGRDAAEERIDDEIEEGEDEDEDDEDDDEEKEEAAVAISKAVPATTEETEEIAVGREPGREVKAGEGTISGLIPNSTAVPVMPTKAESKKPALDRSIRYHRTGFTSDNVSDTCRVDCQGSFRCPSISGIPLRGLKIVGREEEEGVCVK